MSTFRPLATPSLSVADPNIITAVVVQTAEAEEAQLRLIRREAPPIIQASSSITTRTSTRRYVDELSESIAADTAASLPPVLMSAAYVPATIGRPPSPPPESLRPPMTRYGRLVRWVQRVSSFNGRQFYTKATLRVRLAIVLGVLLASVLTAACVYCITGSLVNSALIGLFLGLLGWLRHKTTLVSFDRELALRSPWRSVRVAARLAPFLISRPVRLFVWLLVALAVYWLGSYSITSLPAGTDLPALFVRYTDLWPPAASRRLECSELSGDGPLRPSNDTRVLDALEQARLATGNFSIALPPMLSMHDVCMAAERALAAVPSLACACAPMFGALVRHAAVRRPHGIEHLYNVDIFVTASALAVDNRHERQDYLFPQAPTGNMIRRRHARIQVDYVNASCTPKRATLTATAAYCMQACAELFRGESIYTPV